MTTENEVLVVLPDEVAQLANKVSIEKQSEVQIVLSQIFAGTADWKKQAESITVKDVNDKLSIQMAEAGRKNVKNARLAAEKIFDAKRDSVQQQMSEFKLEDSLWLKAKQTAQILFKDIETTFEWKSKFVERYEAEQKQLRTELRIEKVAKFNPEINQIEFENMSDVSFEVFLNGIEKQFNDNIEAANKLEAERLAKIEADKIERKRIEDENAKLKAEADAKEKALAIERAEAAKVAAKLKADADAENARLKSIADAEKAASDLAIKKLQDEKQAAEDALTLRRNQELKAKQQQEAADKKAAKAPDKVKLLKWVNELPKFNISDISIASNATATELNEKLESFKNWAKTKIESL